jgi:hypothetical protein
MREMLSPDILTLGDPSFVETFNHLEAVRTSGQPYPSQTPFHYVDEGTLALHRYIRKDTQATILMDLAIMYGFSGSSIQPPEPGSFPISNLPS